MKSYFVSFSIVCTVAGIIFFTINSKSQCFASDKPFKKADPGDKQTATFAGGCFWCVEADFEKLAGVALAVSGYCGGDEENPTYEQVSSGTTRHLEAVQITFDPGQVSYKELLDYFWRHIDPTDSGGQFVDRGKQYQTAVFYHDEHQRAEAESSKKALEDSKKFSDPIVTKILPLKNFYPAEDYHQDYYKKKPLAYKFYRFGSGRDRFLNKHWK
jgi:peptide methionine sulfoxide reductase msrA/msrB